MPTIVCPGCAWDVALRGLEDVSGFAVCRRCGTLFEAAVSLYDGHPRTKCLIPAPASFVVSPTDSLAAGYREGADRRAFAVSWPLDDVRLNKAMLWLFGAFFWVLAGLSALGARDTKHAEVGLVIIFAALAIPGLGTLYLLLVAHANRTRLSVKDGFLCSRHGPIPWSGGAEVRIADIHRLLCSQSKRGRHGEYVSFALNARLRSGEVRALVSHLDRPATALYLQQRLEEALELPPPAS